MSVPLERVGPQTTYHGRVGVRAPSPLDLLDAVVQQADLGMKSARSTAARREASGYPGRLPPLGMMAHLVWAAMRPVSLTAFSVYFAATSLPCLTASTVADAAVVAAAATEFQSEPQSPFI